jgi:hypothetical protein
MFFLNSLMGKKEKIQEGEILFLIFFSQMTNLVIYLQSYPLTLISIRPTPLVGA